MKFHKTNCQIINELNFRNYLKVYYSHHKKEKILAEI